MASENFSQQLSRPEYNPMEKVYVTTNAHSKDKRFSNFFDVHSGSFHKRIKSDLFLFTATFIKDEVSLSNAWKMIKIREKRIIEILKNQPDVVYIISTIETHDSTRAPAKKLTKRKDKGKAEGNSGGGKLVFEVPPEEYYYEIIRVFSERNDRLEVQSALNEVEIIARALMFVINCGVPQEYRDCILVMIVNMSKENKPIILDSMWREYIYRLLLTVGQGYLVKGDENTLNGYPHLHMAIACTTFDGQLRNERSIERLIWGVFYDVRNKRSEKHPGRKADFNDNANILGYVFKNCRHLGTKMSLERNPTQLINVRGGDVVYQFFAKFCQDTPGIIDGIPQTYLTSHISSVSDEDKSSVVTTKEISTSFPTPLSVASTVKLDSVSVVGSADDDFNEEDSVFRQDIIGDGTSSEMIVTTKPGGGNRRMQAVNYFVSFMQTYGYVIGDDDGFIYQKKEGTKQTWEIWGSKEDLIAESADYDHVDLMMGQDGYLLKYMSRSRQRIFPKILMTYHWVEFSDFYFHIPSGNYVYEQNIWPCFCCLKESFSDLQAVNEQRLKPDLWYRILYHSGYIDSFPNASGMILCKNLYELFLPRTHKNKVPFLVGPSNCCKTSLLAPLMDMYPIEKIATIGRCGGFEKSIFQGKEVLLFDEFKLGSSGLTKEDLLKVMEGNVIVFINAKFKDPKSEMIGGRPIFISNDMSDYVVRNEEASVDFSKIVRLGDKKSVEKDTSGVIRGETYSQASATILSMPKTVSYQYGPTVPPPLHYRVRIPDPPPSPTLPVMCYDYKIDPVFASRVNFYEMRPLPPGEITPGFKEKMCLEEKGIVFMVLLTMYFDGKIVESTVDKMKELIRVYTKWKGTGI
jgi:hypothetical protein